MHLTQYSAQSYNDSSLFCGNNVIIYNIILSSYIIHTLLTQKQMGILCRKGQSREREKDGKKQDANKNFSFFISYTLSEKRFQTSFYLGKYAC